MTTTVTNGINQPPTVSLVSPVNGQTVQNTISLLANASDDLGVTKVEFYQGSNLIFSDTTSPYTTSFNTRTLPNGPATFSAKAYDAAGLDATSSITVTSENDLTAPTVSITSPVSGTVFGQVSIVATASDNIGVDHVDFYAGGTLIGGDALAPYGVSWDTTLVSAGTYELKAIAYDAANNAGQSVPVPVTISASCTMFCDIIDPIVWMKDPLTGDTISGNYTLSAEANDENQIARVSFYNGTTLIGTDTTSPFEITWDTVVHTNGTYYIAAKAYDTSENEGVSNAVTVTISNTSLGNTSPTANIISPTDGTILKGTKINIKTAATDNMAVTKMEIYMDNILIATSTPNISSATFNYTYDTRNLTKGNHTITLKTYDATGIGGVVSINVIK